MCSRLHDCMILRLYYASIERSILVDNWFKMLILTFTTINDLGMDYLRNSFSYDESTVSGHEHLLWNHLSEVH